MINFKTKLEEFYFIYCSDFYMNNFYVQFMINFQGELNPDPHNILKYILTISKIKLLETRKYIHTFK